MTNGWVMMAPASACGMCEASIHTEKPTAGIGVAAPSRVSNPS